MTAQWRQTWQHSRHAPSCRSVRPKAAPDDSWRSVCGCSQHCSRAHVRRETILLVIEWEVGLFVHASIITVQQLTLRLTPVESQNRCPPSPPAVARPTQGLEAAAVTASKAAAGVRQHAPQQRSSRRDSSRSQRAGPAAASQVAGAGASVGPSATAGGNLKMPLHGQLYIICKQKE